MDNRFNPLNQKGYGKDTKKKTQMERVYQAFFASPKTMLMVADETGILRGNICRYISQMEISQKITLVKRDHCRITKHEAGYYTTDPGFFPSTNQLTLF